MIITQNIKNSWEVHSLIDFANKFKEQEVLKLFPDVDDIQDVYESKEFVCDEDAILQVLETRKEKYQIRYIESYKEEYWLIEEVEQ